MEEFPEFLLRKFREWESTTKKRQSATAFARYLGVKQPTLTRWLNGDNPPDLPNIQKLAKKLGNEIYLVSFYSVIPETDRKETLDEIGQWLHDHGFRKIK